MEHKIFVSGLRASTLALLPCEWNSKTRKLFPSESWWKLLGYYSTFGLNVAYFLLLVWVGWPYTAAGMLRATSAEYLNIFLHVTLIAAECNVIASWVLSRSRVPEFLAFLTCCRVRVSAKYPKVRRQEQEFKKE